MQRQITFRQYRMMDLFLFAAMLCVSEALITLGANRWFQSADFILSLSCAVMAIVMVRWGAWASVVVAAGSAVFCLAQAMTLPGGILIEQVAIYVLGSQAGLVMLLYLKKAGWKKMQRNVVLALLYGLLTALSMQIGRGLVALALGGGWQNAVGFITTDVLSTLFSVLLCGIGSRLDGLMEEQKHYLFRIQREKEDQQG